MSIWGKVVGGAAGFALGGPIGALLGVMAGHMADRYREDVVVAPGDDGTRKIAFTIGVIVLSAKMAKADGHVTRDEIKVFRQIFQVPPHEVKNVGRVFDLARQDAGGYEPYARQIANLFKDRPAVLEDLLGSLFMIAKADGTIHPAELVFLDDIATIFGFTATQFDTIKAAHLTGDKADPYTVLGVAPDISAADLKKKYRALIKEHHPDALIAQGLPEEFIVTANEKMAAINMAYDQICKRRGLA